MMERVTTFWIGMLTGRLSLAKCGWVRNMCTEAAPKYTGSRKLKANRPIVKQQRARNTDLQAHADAKKLDWRIMGATILHRYPIITKDAQPWETAFYDMQERADEMRREYLVEHLQGSAAENFIPDSGPSYEEILESMPFKPASRITEADKANDRRSPDRRLQDSLFLIVKRNREHNSWQFPQGKIKETENLRAASERVIDRAVGNTNRWFVSNAPSGHFCYEYPADVQAQRKNFGAKVFYYRAQLLAGTIKLETKLYTDYAWIARDEVHEYFDPVTADFMKHLLLD